MKRFTNLLWILLVFLSLPFVSKATHIMGVDLTYECINNCTIRVHLRAYRDCTGASTISPNNFTFAPQTFGCAQPTAIMGSWSTQVTTEVTPICPGMTTKCTNPSGTINGCQEYYWYRDYNICGLGVNCIFNLTWTDCCRNNAITSGAASDDIYIGATTLNANLPVCNNSPQFANKPVPYICAGQPFTFNQGAIDPDGDSLSYALGPCYQNNASTIGYNAGYSPTAPLGASWGVTIDPTTGDITLNPQPGNTVVGVLCVYVYEWRNGVQINTIVRDMQITVLNCPANNLPTTTGINSLQGAVQNNTIEITTCVGANIQFNLPGSDANAAQNLKMYWNQALAGASFYNTSNPAQRDTIYGGNPVSATFTWTPTAIGLFTFLVTIKDNACPFIGTLQFTVKIHVVNGLPGATQAHTITGCTSANFTANPGSGGVPPLTYTWTGVPGPSASTQNTSYTYPGAGLFHYQLVIEDSLGCTVTFNDSLTFNPPPASTVGTDTTMCNTTTRAITANAAGTGNTGTWSVVSGSGTFVNANSPNTTVNGLGFGTNLLVWTVTNALCPTAKDTMTIIVDPPPTTSNAGPNQTVCGSNATLAANTPSVGTGLWTVVSGAGTFANASNPNTTVSGLAPGANVFRWTITNTANCPASQSTVTITSVLPPTTANAGGDQTICQSANLILAANTATTGTGTWTVISGTGTFTNASNPTTPVTGLSIGVNTYQWTITNAPCPQSADQVTITVDAQPSAAVPGPNASVCGTNYTMTGTAPAVGTGTWSVVSGSGTFANPNSATSSVSGLTPGPNTFTWTVSNTPACPNTSANVTITAVQSPTVANAGPDQTICQTTTPTLAANTPLIGTGAWSVSSGTGFFTNGSNPGTTVTGLSVGANTFTWTISNAPCPATTDQVTINVDGSPTPANAGPDQTICVAPGTATMAATALTTGTGAWTIASGGGIIANPTSNTSSVSSIPVGTSRYVWTTHNGVCPDTRDTIQVQVDPLPSASNAGPDQTVCDPGTLTLAGNTPAVGNGTWSVVSGTGNFNTPSTPAATVTGYSIGANTYRWTITSGVCPPANDQVVINVDGNPTPANAGPNQTICASTTNLAGNAPVIGTGQWSTLNGGSINPGTSPNATASGLFPGTFFFVWTTSNGVCPSTRDTVAIQVDAMPTTAIAGPDQLWCDSANAVLTGNMPSIGTGAWSVTSGTANISNPNLTQTGVSGLIDGTVTVFTWTISNGVCPPSSDQMQIQIDAMPSIADAGIDQKICEGDPVILNAANPAIGTGLWTSAPGPNIQSPTQPQSAVGSLQPGNTYIFTWTLSNGVCPSNSDQVNVRFVDVPDLEFDIDDPDGCVPHTVVFTNTSQHGATYFWDFGDPPSDTTNGAQTVSHTFNSPGWYSVTLVAENEGCYDTLSKTNLIETVPQPIPAFIEDPVFNAKIMAGMPVVFTNQSLYADTYVWNFNDGITSTLVNPTHNFDIPGFYCVDLTAISSYGCENTVEVCSLEVIEGHLYFPNAFTPNGDGKNETFAPANTWLYKTYSFEVYDRWGKFIFSGKIGDSWDGKFSGSDSPEGVYIWKFKGLTINDITLETAGTVTLMR